MSSTAHKTRVVCIGNPIAADDGVGIRIGEMLAEMDLQPHVEVESLPVVGIDLLDVLHPDEHLILVDASCTGAAPGTVRVFDLDDLVSMSTDHACLHSVGICDVLNIARRVAPQSLPSAVHVVAVEGQRFNWLAKGLSPEVEAAIPQAIEALFGLVEGDRLSPGST